MKLTNVKAEHRPYLRRREAAKYLGCSVRLIDELKHNGDLPFCRLGRRLIVFKTTDLDGMMSRRRIDIREADSVTAAGSFASSNM